MREDVEYMEGDLIINTFTMDVNIIESDPQHVEDTISATPGTWPEHPADGVSLMSYLGASGEEQTLERETKRHLQNDGYQCDGARATILNDKINLYPNVRRV